MAKQNDVGQMVLAINAKFTVTVSFVEKKLLASGKVFYDDERSSS